MSDNSIYASGQSSWLMTEDLTTQANTRHSETLYSQGNGYLGIRGTVEENSESDEESCEGVYLNGAYSREPIPYGEIAYGFATHNQKLLQVPNSKAISLTSTQTPYSVFKHQRVLDQKTGILTRYKTLSFDNESRLNMEVERFVSMSCKNLLCIRYTVSSEDFEGELTLNAGLDSEYGSSADANDPRAGQLSIQESISLLETELSENQLSLYHSVQGTDFVIASCCIDQIGGNATVSPLPQGQQQTPEHTYRIDIKPGQTFELIRFALYHYDQNLAAVKQQQTATLQQIGQQSYEALKARHCEKFAQFWKIAQLKIEGDASADQGLRFNAFHLFQSAGRDGISSIAAKGLSGPGYDGHYFWDTEIYIVPFFTFTAPEIAKQLVMYRYNTLDSARQRARQMGHDTGALFAWRTIGGEECSAYYPASTAQYHINAAVAYAIKTYFEGTGDWQLVLDYGAEVVIETARIWLSLGHFNKEKDGQFCINGVTGPDEYTAVVNNNFYTNMMAKQHLNFAVDLCAKIQQLHPDIYTQLSEQLAFAETELQSWKQAAGNMYLPFDEARQIHLQDDAFLNKKVWDLVNQPTEKMPLLLHYHPLVIYRHQVLKQADVILAMFLADQDYSIEQKASNLAYYEPLTTHDSTLSSCIHSIEYAETGELEKAYDYFIESARMDLDNLHHNTEYGVHTACMAGSWNAVIFGFIGMRARGEVLSFKPRLPSKWTSVSFQISFRGSRLSICATNVQTEFTLIEGPALSIDCEDTRFELNTSLSHKCVRRNV